MSNKVIRLDTLKKNVYDINKYDPDYMFNLKAFVNYAIKLYNSNILEDFPKDIIVDGLVDSIDELIDYGIIEEGSSSSVKKGLKLTF